VTGGRGIQKLAPGELLLHDPPDVPGALKGPLRRPAAALDRPLSQAFDRHDASQVTALSDGRPADLHIAGYRVARRIEPIQLYSTFFSVSYRTASGTSSRGDLGYPS
jgi:hypothetical protein